MKKYILAIVIVTLFLGTAMLPVGANTEPKIQPKENDVRTFKFALVVLIIQEPTEVTYTEGPHIFNTQIYYNVKITGIYQGNGIARYIDVIFQRFNKVWDPERGTTLVTIEMSKFIGEIGQDWYEGKEITYFGNAWPSVGFDITATVLE
jgi:hypothetical protein